MYDKLGKTFIDGKLVDLDNASIEDIGKMLARLQEREKEIMQEINKQLSIVEVY